MRVRVAASLFATACILSSSAFADTRLSRGFVPIQDGVKITDVTGSLEFPGGLAALPDGTLLITQRDGDIRILKDGQLPDTVVSFPVEVMSSRNGPDGTLDDNQTAIGRATWTGKGLKDFEEIFSVSQGKRDGQHFGSRLAFLPDGTLLATIGDGGNPPEVFLDTFEREQAQNLQSQFGTVIRLKPDGSVPEGNPFVELEGAKPEIWSFGHRNAQGIVVDPESGAVWSSEHGPLGGDELNLVEKGENYGWPRVTFGRDYRDGSVLTARIEGPTYSDPTIAWVDTHAPGGPYLYTGSAFPDWKGDLLSAGFASRDIRRIEIEDGKVVGEKRIDCASARPRGFATAPDGTLYVVTDRAEERVLRLDPS